MGEDKTRELDDKKSKIESLKTTLNASIKSIGEATRDLVPSGSSYSTSSSSSSPSSLSPFSSASSIDNNTPSPRQQERKVGMSAPQQEKKVENPNFNQLL